MFHNVLSYAHGLLDELAGALRLGRDDVAEEVRAELAVVRAEVSKIDPKTLEGDAATAYGRLAERLATLDAPATATDGAQADGKPAGKARTAKAAAAPETAVAPPAA